MYESFEEIAVDFKDGNHWTHILSDHKPEECYAWQHGVTEFAKFLDAVGVRIIEDLTICEKLWEEVRTHKPDESTFSDCCKSAQRPS
jgi:hypothetical protein